MNGNNGNINRQLLIILAVILGIQMCIIQQVQSLNLYRESRIRIESEVSGGSTKSNKCNCVCGLSNRQMRIVGGNITKVNEFPWMAGLSRQGKHYCGASLVTKRHLLTAAHCVDGFDIDSIKITLGRHNINTDQTDTGEDTAASIRTFNERKIKSIKTHPSFNIFNYNNDIAILELDEPVDFGPNLQPACLPQKAEEDYSGKVGIVTGWGRTEERKAPSNVLRKVSVPIWSHDQCLDAGYGKKRITRNMLCAGYHDGQKDACQGDSGGPMHLYSENSSLEIVGLVSWGRGCARPNYPGIYTRVANYLEWLHLVLEDECLCAPQNSSSN